MASTGAADTGGRGEAGVGGASATTNTAGSGGAGAGGPGGPRGQGGVGGVGGAEPPAREAGAGGSSGASGAAAAAGSSGAAADGGGEPTPQNDPDCDSTGVWIARLTTFSRDSIFNSVQTTSNWFYYELSQRGRELRVDKSLDCGIQVSGSADVTLNGMTTAALIHANEQTGRTGELYKEGDGCTFRLSRFYSVRGLSRATYLPSDLSTKPELSALQPPLPTEMAPEGAEDWDEDGQPGIAYNVTGLGSRHVVQRDWNEFFSDETTPIALRPTELVARAGFDIGESIITTSGGLGGLLRAGAVPATGMRHRIVFRRIGGSADDAGSIRGSDDLETCYNVQEALPHDPAMQ